MSFHLLSHKIVKTKKFRRCIGCLEIFAAGSNIHRHVFKSDGEFCVQYTCSCCEEFIISLPRDEFEEGFGAGEIGEMRRLGSSF